MLDLGLVNFGQCIYVHNGHRVYHEYFILVLDIVHGN